jgi:microcystin-dependent protein
MSDPFIGEMRLMPWGWAPRTWARCDGAILAKAQNQALFAILGAAFGGNGNTTFALPDLRGRVPVGAGANSYAVGAAGGEETHLLTTNEVPSHTHPVQGINQAADQPSFISGVFATTASAVYAPPSKNTLALQPRAIQSVGGTPHENRQPYQVITVGIALSGVFPSKN